MALTTIQEQAVKIMVAVKADTTGNYGTQVRMSDAFALSELQKWIATRIAQNNRTVANAATLTSIATSENNILIPALTSITPIPTGN